MDTRQPERERAREQRAGEIEHLLARLGQTRTAGDSAAAFAALLADYQEAVRQRREAARRARDAAAGG